MAKDRKPVNVRVEDSAEHFTTITVNRLNGTILAVPCDTTKELHQNWEKSQVYVAENYLIMV